MNQHERIRKMTTMSLLSAIIVVLQIIATFIKFGPFSITLALTPIIIGAATYGWSAGAFLGFVFSLVVFVSGVLGWDGGFVLAMMDYSLIGTVIICLGKGTIAGAIAGLVYKAIKNKNAASILSAIITPIVNTGLFALGIITIFNGFLSAGVEGSGYGSAVALLFLGWIGVNFIVEFIVNVALGSTISRLSSLLTRKKAK